ncbi:MAG: Hsp20 family protein [Rhodospirillaceae bacterium]|nr:Hsp20 family protein [Rhodospirillaceae bacterium]
MARMSLLSSPLLLGFEDLERTLDRLSKASTDGYPPYNIERLSDDHLRITLAVAGFTQADLEITVQDNQLLIRGKTGDDTERVYLHRGIAARQFQRSFVLADGIEVAGATLEHGLLHVHLHRPRPESTTRTIKIDQPGSERGDVAVGATVSRQARGGAA